MKTYQPVMPWTSISKLNSILSGKTVQQHQILGAQDSILLAKAPYTNHMIILVYFAVW